MRWERDGVNKWEMVQANQMVGWAKKYKKSNC